MGEYLPEHFNLCLQQNCLHEIDINLVEPMELLSFHLSWKYSLQCAARHNTHTREKTNKQQQRLKWLQHAQNANDKMCCFMNIENYIPKWIHFSTKPKRWMGWLVVCELLKIRFCYRHTFKPERNARTTVNTHAQHTTGKFMCFTYIEHCSIMLLSKQI